MRKLAGLFFLCAGLLFSCQNFTEHDVKITNSSSIEVTFSLERYDRDSYTLASGDSLTLNIFNNPTLVFEGYPRVGYTSGDSVKIFDLTAYTLKIFNNTESEVILTEKHNLLGDESDVSGLSVEANTDEAAADEENPRSSKIYTSNPVFAAKSSDGEETFSCEVSKSTENGETIFILNIEK